MRVCVYIYIYIYIYIYYIYIYIYCLKEILAVFNISGIVSLHCMSPTCRKLRKISEHVPTQEQTMPSNRISQLECVSCFGRQRTLTLFTYTDGSAHVSENTSWFTNHDVGWLDRPMGRTRYGPKHPTQSWDLPSSH